MRNVKKGRCPENGDFRDCRNVLILFLEKPAPLRDLVLMAGDRRQRAQLPPVLEGAVQCDSRQEVGHCMPTIHILVT